MTSGGTGSSGRPISPMCRATGPTRGRSSKSSSGRSGTTSGAKSSVTTPGPTSGSINQPRIEAMPDEPLVHYRRDGDVGVITLSRQPLNTYDGAFHAAFQTAWLTAKADDSHVVVMMATGRHFCAGAGLRNPLPAPEGFTELPAWEEIRLIRSVMKPTIAAVQGGCIGGGQRMVWPCDLVFCTEDAFFRDPTASMGIGGIQSHIHTW